jgi:cephalosporin hydroxylase
MPRSFSRVPALLRRLEGRDIRSFQAPVEQAHAQADDGEFSTMFFSHNGRAMDKWVHYLGAYEEEFSPYRRGFPLSDGGVRPLRLLEIGTRHGGSLQMWRKYFGPEASIWGVDLDSRCAEIDDADLNIRIGSQDDPGFLTDVVEEMGGVDLILDDGSHVARHQMTSLRALFPLLSDGGLYAVEDLHTAYWRDFGGGYHSANSFIEVAKQLIDDMHGNYHRRKDHVGLDARANVPRVAFYDSMVFIRKARRGRPLSTQVGMPSF